MISEKEPRRSGRTGANNARLAIASEAGSRNGTMLDSSDAGTIKKQNRGKDGSKMPQISADRPIFTLSVAADLLGLHPRTLRIYEEKQLVLPARTEGNRRRYSQNDINRFQSIRRLTSAGVNLEGVRIILDMADALARMGGDPEQIIERNLPDAEE